MTTLRNILARILAAPAPDTAAVEALAAEMEAWEWTAPVGPGNASYANGYENGRRSAGAALRAALDAARSTPAPDTAAVEALAEVDRLRSVLVEVQHVFDLQCPPMAADNYVDRGAWMAHRWWNTVLGDVLTRAALAPRATTEGSE